MCIDYSTYFLVCKCFLDNHWDIFWDFQTVSNNHWLLFWEFQVSTKQVTLITQHITIKQQRAKVFSARPASSLVYSTLAYTAAAAAAAWVRCTYVQ